MMRFEVKQANDGPFKMYRVIDTETQIIILTTDSKGEAESFRELLQWNWENRDN